MMPQSEQRRTADVLTMPSIECPSEAAFASGVTQSDAAWRAFERYGDRGRQDDHHVDDPLNAECEWREASNSTAA
jgi:hypothetical protein